MSELKEELRASRAEQGSKRRHEINQAAPSRFRVAGFRKEIFTLGNCRVATPAVASKAHSNFKYAKTSFKYTTSREISRTDSGQTSVLTVRAGRSRQRRKTRGVDTSVAFPLTRVPAFGVG